jgi:autotransporter-associated beta strand protein
MSMGILLSRFSAFFYTLIFLFLPLVSWGQIAAWDLTSAVGNEATQTASKIDAHLNPVILSRGSGINASKLATAFASTGFITTAGATITDAVTANEYYQFSVNPKTSFKASLTTLNIKLRRSSTAPSKFQWRYSLDNFTTSVNIGTEFTNTSTTTTGNAQTPIDLSAIADLQNVTNATTITFRLYCWGGTSSTASVSIGKSLTAPNNFSLALGGTVTSLNSPTKLAIIVISPTSPTAGTGFSVTVQAQDGNSDVSNVNANTAISLTTNGNAGAIGGTTTGTINAGSNSVTITGVTLAALGTGATITATRTSGDALTAITSTAFDVLAAASQLVFVGVPLTGSTAANLTSFTVEARRPDNSVDNSYTGTITIAKATGSGTLSGTTTAAAVAGIATFSTLQLSTADTYTFTASATGFTSITSNNIVISVSTIIGWNNATTGTAWYTSTSWTPNTATAAWLTTHIAQFENTGTATKAQINMGTSSLSIGAINVTSNRTRSLTIDNSNSTTAGTLTLNGNTVNSEPNTILRNASNSLLSIQNGSAANLGIVLANSTENLIRIDGNGSIDIGSVISGNAKNLAFDGTGAGVLILSGINTFSGYFKIKNDTVNLKTNGALSAATNVTIASSGYLWTSLDLTDAFNDNADLILNDNAVTDFSGGSETVGSISSTSPTTLLFIGDNGLHSGNFTVGNASNNTFAGIIDGSKASGSILTKQGSGKLTLTGDNIYSGLTTINAGTLQLNKTGGTTIPITNDVTVNGGTLQISSNQIVNNLIVNGGNVIIDDGITLTINGILTLTSGNITLGTTGTGNLITTTISGGSSTAYIVTNGSGGLTVSNFTGSKVFPIGPTASIYAPATVLNNASSRDFSIKVSTTFSGTPSLTTKMIQLQWDITPSNLTGNNANLTFQWPVSSKNSAFDLSKPIQIIHYNGASWGDAKLATLAGSDPYTASASGFTNFSPFAITNPTSLSVDLLKLEAKQQTNTTLVTWQTASEKNNAYFDIEHATDGTHFKSLEHIKGNGSTTALSPYTFEHLTPSVGRNYYRLKQIDVDGSETISTIVSVEFKDKKGELTVYPTLATDYIHVLKPADKEASFQIVNALGQIILRGHFTNQIDVSNLQSGVYILNIDNQAIKFIKK